MKNLIPLFFLISIVLFSFTISPCFAEDNIPEYNPNDTCDQEIFPASDEFVALDKPPEMTFQSVPEFPEMAKMNGTKNAEIWVRVLVDRCGNVRKAEVQISSGNKCGFDESAVKAAYQCKFDPAMVDHQPVAAWVTYKVVFGKELKVSDKGE